MVEDADKNQAPTQRIADRWASFLVPIALLIAVGAYLFTGNIVRAVTVMVVFCPCALVLATPTAIMAAIGQATKHGVIIKSGEALEKMGKVDTIAFDKTGTLTYGRLEVTDVIVAKIVIMHSFCYPSRNTIAIIIKVIMLSVDLLKAGCEVRAIRIPVPAARTVFVPAGSHHRQFFCIIRTH